MWMQNHKGNYSNKQPHRQVNAKDFCMMTNLGHMQKQPSMITSAWNYPKTKENGATHLRRRGKFKQSASLNMYNISASSGTYAVQTTAKQLTSALFIARPWTVSTDRIPQNRIALMAITFAH